MKTDTLVQLIMDEYDRTQTRDTFRKNLSYLIELYENDRVGYIVETDPITDETAVEFCQKWKAQHDWSSK